MAVDIESVVVRDDRMYGRTAKLLSDGLNALFLGSTGYLSGDFPGGVTTVDGTPVEATVRVLIRSIDPALNGLVVSEVKSAPSGVWRVDGLMSGLKYDIVGRKAGFNDVIAANVSPLDPPRIFDSVVQAYIGIPLEHAIATFGGAEPLLVTKKSGTLPEGITFSGGKLSGSWPTGSKGGYPIEFTVTDASGDSTDKTVTVELILLPLELATSKEVPEGYISDRDIQPITFTASGGEGPYTFSTTGTLPPGLNFNAGTGELTGKPSTNGSYSFSVKVTDIRNSSVGAFFDIEVVSAFEVFNTNLALNKPIDSNNEISYQTSSSSPVNGDTNTSNYTSYGSDEAWLSVDLGDIYNINKIKGWLYYSDNRRYYEKRWQYSVDGIVWVSVYDDTVDPIYSETSAGKEFVFTKDAARYVRVITNGSSSNGGNHAIEIQAYLTEP